MTNTNLLKSHMVKHGDTNMSVADLLGISRNYVSEKLNNKRDFKQSEIQFFINRYNLSSDEVIDIFFKTTD